MDINSFYAQARAWQMDKEHQEREQELQHQQQLADAWKGAKNVIKETFPLEEAQLFETEPGQTSSFPYVGGNYQFDLVLPGVAYRPVFDEERSMKGVIRCVANCYVTGTSCSAYTFKLIGFYVWVDGSSQRFENPFEAFLACCDEIGYKPVIIE